VRLLFTAGPAYRAQRNNLFREGDRMGKRKPLYSIRFNRIEQEKIEFGRMGDRDQRRAKRITHSKSPGIVMGEAEIFLSPFQSFCLFSFRHIGIVEPETLHLPADIGPIAFVEIQYFY